MNYFLYFVFYIIEFKFVMYFVLQSKTNKDKSTEIFPPLLKPTYICACALPKAKKG